MYVCVCVCVCVCVGVRMCMCMLVCFHRMERNKHDFSYLVFVLQISLLYTLTCGFSQFVVHSYL